MPSSRRAAIGLTLILAAFAPVGAAGQTIGEVAAKEREVFGEALQRPRRALQVLDTIEKEMRVSTAKLSAALITIGKRVGAVTMGPESELVFRRGVIDVATGAAEDLDFFTQAGQFRFVFLPKPKTGEAEKVLGVSPHQVVIHAPKATITLYGTDVYLSVSPRGDTTVYVAEGEVAIQSDSGGAEVRVPAGTLSQVVDGGAPSAPRPYRAAGAVPPASRWGGIEASVLADPFVTLPSRLFLDLPR